MASYSQKFRDIWLKDPLLKDWLLKIDSTAGPIGKCNYCGNLLTSNKYSDLKTHYQSRKHKRNMEIIQGKTQTRINFSKESDLTASKAAEARLALFVACHTPLATVDHLVMTCKSCFKCTDIQHLKMHRTKCSGIIRNVFLPYFQECLKNDINNSPYSILIDESTDISVQKYLGCAIIFFDVNTSSIISTVLELGQLEKCDAEGITTCLLNLIKKFKLPLENFQGLGTDNAAVMTGVNKGVFTKLKELCPDLVLIRCVCHSLQLAAVAASKEMPRNLEFLIRETYDWFSKSHLRKVKYKDAYLRINGKEPLKIPQACDTRWLSISLAVNQIYNQWFELKSHFEECRYSEKCYTAELLYQMYRDEQNYAFVCFIKPVLHDLNVVNKCFESNNADPTKLLDDLVNLLNSYVSKVTTSHSKYRLFEDKIDDFVDKNCYLGHLFEIQIKKMRDGGLPVKKEMEIRERCISFLIVLIKEISNRIPENVNILKQVSHFSVRNALAHQKPDITELVSSFNKMKSDDISKIINQWQNVHLLKWIHITDTVKFWAEVYNYKNSINVNPFSELATFAISLLTLPYSNAEIERVFSQMNLVKTKLRNRLSLDTLNAILTTKAYLRRKNVCCHDYELPAQIITQIKTNSSYNKRDELEEVELDPNLFI